LRLRHWIFIILIASLACGALLEVSLYNTIRRQAASDEAQPAAAIVVFGAAEYNGRPSPVYKARLDHAFYLEEHGFALLVITTGGSGGDRHFTEGGVGRDYLIQQGVAARGGERRVSPLPHQAAVFFDRYQRLHLARSRKSA
jgi:uncharacterized SAM-binding protein YcdF (DUF218 family)